MPVARYGPPGNPDYSDDDPTVYSNYGNYGGPGEPPPGPPAEAPVPWYRKPAALVAFGAIGAVLVALIVWGLASLISGPSSEPPPPSLTPITPTSAPPRTTTTATTAPTTTEPTTATTTTTTEPTTTTTTNDDHHHNDHDDHHVADYQRQHQHGDRDGHRPGGLALTRITYAHDAVVTLNEGGDSAAPGGAITVALCGHWDHEPPCPMAPHHTDAVPAGDGTLRLRVLFASDDEARIRALIDQALSSGRLTGPDDRVTTWTVRSSTAGTVRPDEADHAARLASS